MVMHLAGQTVSQSNAPHAAGGAILAHGEPVAAAEPRHEGPELLGILDGDRGGKVLETAQAVGRVEKEVSEEVGGGDLESANDLGDVELFPESQLWPADNFYGHYSVSPRKISTTAVTTALTTAIGNSPLQPSFMSWS